MENNKCFVASLGNIRKIEGADRIVLADVLLKGMPITQVVVGTDTQEGSKVVYFDSNLCVSDQIIKDYPDIGKYLSKHNRVKCIKLRGCISNGLVVDVIKFRPYFNNDKEYDKFVCSEGKEFTAINDFEVCHKYVPPPPRNSHGNSDGKRRKNEPSRLIDGIFHFHTDTSQLLRNVHKIKPNDVISISRKVHGSSGIASNSLVKRKLSWIEKLMKRIGVKVNTMCYDYLYASRSVVKNSRQNCIINENDIWVKAGKEKFLGKLHKGETVYYEIVGYLPSGAMVQKGYNYGCNVGEYKVAVYRITFTNEDGNVFEYGWQAMKDRCKEIGVDTVEEYYYGRATDKFDDIKISTEDVEAYMKNQEEAATETVLDRHTKAIQYVWAKEFVQRLKKEYLEKKCEDCINNPPDEGIVVRIEGIHIEAYKLKSELFTLRESANRDNGEEDIEDTESANVEEDK